MKKNGKTQEYDDVIFVRYIMAVSYVPKPLCRLAYGFFKLLVFGRILNPASKWSTVKQNKDYALPLLKENSQDYNVYKALDFIYDHRGAVFNRINTSMVKNYHRTTQKIYYDVTNFFFEIDEPEL